MSDSLWPHESQHIRPPCPSPTPRVHPNSCASSRWCHPAISSSVVPFSSCPQSFQASGSFPMSQLLAWGGQSIRVSASASVLPMNTQDWSPLRWTCWISLQSKGLSGSQTVGHDQSDSACIDTSLFCLWQFCPSEGWAWRWHSCLGFRDPGGTMCAGTQTTSAPGVMALSESFFKPLVACSQMVSLASLSP